MPLTDHQEGKALEEELFIGCFAKPTLETFSTLFAEHDKRDTSGPAKALMVEEAIIARFAAVDTKPFEGVHLEHFDSAETAESFCAQKTKELSELLNIEKTREHFGAKITKVLQAQAIAEVKRTLIGVIKKALQDKGNVEESIVEIFDPSKVTIDEVSQSESGVDAPKKLVDAIKELRNKGYVEGSISEIFIGEASQAESTFEKKVSEVLEETNVGEILSGFVELALRRALGIPSKEKKGENIEGAASEAGLFPSKEERIALTQSSIQDTFREFILSSQLLAEKDDFEEYCKAIRRESILKHRATSHLLEVSYMLNCRLDKPFADVLQEAINALDEEDKVLCGERSKPWGHSWDEDPFCESEANASGIEAYCVQCISFDQKTLAGENAEITLRDSVWRVRVINEIFRGLREKFASEAQPYSNLKAVVECSEEMARGEAVVNSIKIFSRHFIRGRFMSSFLAQELRVWKVLEGKRRQNGGESCKFSSHLREVFSDDHFWDASNRLYRSEFMKRSCAEAQGLEIGQDQHHALSKMEETEKLQSESWIESLQESSWNLGKYKQWSRKKWMNSSLWEGALGERFLKVLTVREKFVQTLKGDGVAAEIRELSDILSRKGVKFSVPKDQKQENLQGLYESLLQNLEQEKEFFGNLAQSLVIQQEEVSVAGDRVRTETDVLEVSKVGENQEIAKV